MKKESWLSRLFHQQDTSEVIGSPLSGRSIPLEEVADPTFSGKVLGDGMAVIPSEGRLYAPADGKIENLMDTGHALGLTTKNLGVEILIHVGRDTVSLGGKHFTLHCKEGDLVKRGQLLLEFDLEALLSLGFDLTTPVIVCNGDEFAMEAAAPGEIAPGEALLTLQKKEA